MKKLSKNRIKVIVISLISVLLAIPFLLLPISAILVYECSFGINRYETASWMSHSAEDFEGLSVERVDFDSDGIRLAGYKYSKECDVTLGVVIIAHGLGGGGHNTYMPFIDVFTSNGYLCFAYDACGNDNSDGNSVEGLPRGIVDLDSAINYVGEQEEYKELPIALFGHSWGGYSVGNVLSLHPEVSAAVIIAGFNESEDLLFYEGERFAGKGAGILLPYMELYERIKFGGKYSDITAVEGMQNSNAGIMVVHSKDDGNVPVEYGYDLFYKEFCDSERFSFVLYEDRGHNYLFYSDDSTDYRDELNAAYKSYIEDGGREYNGENKEAFMNEYLDKKRCFEPDPELMESIINMFDEYCNTKEVA